MAKLGKPMEYKAALIKASELFGWLKCIRGVRDVVICGSIRRKAPVCNDVDLVLVSDSGEIPSEVFERAGADSRIKGTVKWTFVDTDGTQVDIMSCTPEQVGSFMMHCTGSKWENIRLRTLAGKKGWNLSQYGLDVSGPGQPTEYLSSSEEDIYRALEEPYKHPEQR